MCGNVNNKNYLHTTYPHFSTLYIDLKTSKIYIIYVIIKNKNTIYCNL
jgi:hypothetical protein